MTTRFQSSLIILTMTLTSCASLKKHGDGILVDRHDIVWVMLDELRFPKIPLSSPATYVYKVRNLPVGILPTAYFLEVPYPESLPPLSTQPWNDVVVSVEAIDLKGESIYSQKINFRKNWKGSSMPGRGGKRKIWIRGTNWRHNLHRLQAISYDLHITVISPSKRATDRLEILAMTRIQGDYMNDTFADEKPSGISKRQTSGNFGTLHQK